MSLCERSGSHFLSQNVKAHTSERHQAAGARCPRTSSSELITAPVVPHVIFFSDRTTDFLDFFSFFKMLVLFLFSGGILFGHSCLPHWAQSWTRCPGGEGMRWGGRRGVDAEELVSLPQSGSEAVTVARCSTSAASILPSTCSMM